MTEISRAFRDYATRVSFNMSLSRNQVGHLAGIVSEIENDKFEPPFDERVNRKWNSIENAGGNPSLFVVSRRSLMNMGLVVNDPRWTEWTEKRHVGYYNGPGYQLTEAGKHVVELLRIAGLIPKAAANTQVVKKRKKA